jgi:hypothetical protein
MRRVLLSGSVVVVIGIVVVGLRRRARAKAGPHPVDAPVAMAVGHSAPPVDAESEPDDVPDAAA